MEDTNSKKILEIHANPTLDEVWDLCVRNFLYDQKKYVNEVLEIFARLGITKESKIADVSAGGGFPALNLIALGYKVDCFDGFATDLFDQNAKKEGQDVTCKKALWEELPELVSPGEYDFVFCRGNSFIYAGGGWSETSGFDIEKVRADYIKTAKIFAGMLKAGGYMYIDKFKDSELGYREKLATIKVGSNLEDLVFFSERSPESKLRKASVQRMAGGDVTNFEVKITYDLSKEELINFLKEGGFSDVEVINSEVPEEKHFDVWLAKK